MFIFFFARHFLRARPYRPVRKKFKTPFRSLAALENLSVHKQDQVSQVFNIFKMAANSVLFDFSIEANRVTDESSRKDIVKVIKENLEKYFSSLTIVYDMLVKDGYLCILSDNLGVITTVRFFNEGLITINIEYFKKEAEPSKLSFEVSFSFSYFFISYSNAIQHEHFALVLVVFLTNSRIYLL